MAMKGKAAPLAKRGDDDALYGNKQFRIMPTGLVIEGDPSFEKWRDFGQVIATLGNASQWAIGDWLLYGEGRGDWGETYTQAASETGRSAGTLANAVSVCKRFEVSRRREDLPFSFHAEVMPLDDEAADAMLQRAFEQKWTREELREHVKDARGVEGTGGGGARADSDAVAEARRGALEEAVEICRRRREACGVASCPAAAELQGLVDAEAEGL